MNANSEGSSANPALHFGHQVRKQRKRRGWSIHELADRAGIAVGHLSMVENGRRPPTGNVATKIDAVFPERGGWFTDFYNDSQSWTPPGTRHWFEHEDRARHLRVWTPGVVDGLVQVAEYARAHLQTVPGVPAEVVEARLQARMARQRRIVYGDKPPSIVVLIDELALFRLVGSPEVMVMQLGHLSDMARLPHVTVHVVPAVAHAATGAALEVAPEASYTEHLGGGVVYIEEESVAAFERLIAELQADACRASESLEIIERVKHLWARGESPLTALLRAEPASK